MTGVRLRLEGFEGFCETCPGWWPITRRFWHSNSGLRRCRACVLERRMVPPSKEPVDVRTAERRAYKRDWMRRSRAEQRRRVQLGNLRVVA